MALRNVLLLSQIAGYSIALILSLCVVVPMSLHQDEFSGYCILFSEMLAWDNILKMLYVRWASNKYCHYVLFVGIASMVTCLVQIYRLLMLWVERHESSFLSLFLEVAICSVLSVLSVSAGIIVTVGFMTWCQSVSKEFPSCEDLAGERIYNVYGPTDWFYLHIEVAQVGVWGTFAALVGAGVVTALKLVQQHEARNLHAVAAREETRPLLNSGFPEEGRSTPPPTYT